MRRALFATLAGLALTAACSNSTPTGPAWPKSAGRVVVADPEDDGGESIEPTLQSEHVAAIERGGEPDKPAETSANEGTPTKPPAEGDQPKTDTPTGTVEIQFEEIEVRPDEIIIVN